MFDFELKRLMVEKLLVSNQQFDQLLDSCSRVTEKLANFGLSEEQMKLVEQYITFQLRVQYMKQDMSYMLGFSEAIKFMSVTKAADPAPFDIMA